MQRERVISLEIYNLPLHTSRLVIHMQQPDAALCLAATIIRAAWIEEQLPVHLFIAGNVAMSEYHAARRRKFLARHLRAIMRITQDMHDADAAMPHLDFTLDGQLHAYLIFFNVALHCYYGRNRLQLGYDRQNREVAGVNNQFNARETLPDCIW